MKIIPDKCPKCGNKDFYTYGEKNNGMQCVGIDLWFECDECGHKDLIG